MVKNLGEIALACAIGSERKYANSQIASAAGLDENQVEWMVKAGRSGTLRNVLGACDSVQSFCAFMGADPDVRRQSVKTAIATGEHINQKLVDTARQLVLARAPRKSKVTNTDRRGSV